MKYIKGVGEKRALLLNKLDIHSLDELIRYFPRAYIDFSHPTPIPKLIPGTTACFRAYVGYTPIKNEIRRGMTIYKTLLVDGEYSVHLSIFNNSYLAESLTEGEEYYFYGKILVNRGMLEITNPIIEKADGECVMQPVYPLTAGLTSKMLSKIIANALTVHSGTPTEDAIPDSIRSKYELCHEQFAFRAIHFPKSRDEVELARRRFIFEELLLLQLGMKLLK